MATAAGLVIGAGEIFGGGAAPSIAGGIAQHSGIQYTLYFALGGQLLGLLLALFLRETAPRRTRNAPAGAHVGAGSARQLVAAGLRRWSGPCGCHERAQQPLLVCRTGH